jgi:hypothetical protein
MVGANYESIKKSNKVKNLKTVVYYCTGSTVSGIIAAYMIWGVLNKITGYR